jgi:hypothetical protein
MSLAHIKRSLCKILVVQVLVAGMLSFALPPVSSSAAPNDGQNKKAQQQGAKVANKPSSIRSAGAQSDISDAGLPTPDADNNKVGTVLGIFFGIIGAFAVLNIVLSGFKYITSSGNEQKVSEAKSGIAYALIGLMIAISAEAIVAFVVNGI